MSLENITIKNREYPKPSIDRMKRKQVKKLKPVLERVQAEDLDAIWDLVGLMVPGLPVSVLDDLDMGECKELLESSGVAKFNSGKPAEGEAAAVDGEAITAGESLASTDS